SVGDGSFRPLTQKLLERPRLLARLRDLIVDPDCAIILPFVISELEAALAVELGIPVYGSDPRLSSLGTKSGSRQVFRAAGVDLPLGREDLHSVPEIVDAVDEIWRKTQTSAAMVKLDGSVSGLGNAVVNLKDVSRSSDIKRAVELLEPEDEHLSADEFLDSFQAQGGIAEAKLVGRELASPSVQLRASPLGGIEVLSTHDQILGGGRNQQTYLGCRFPADESYRAALTESGRAIANELSHRGVIGRFGIDFVVHRDDDDSWRVAALEVNLRNGGTTHPMLTLMGLTSGDYDEETGEFRSGDKVKHYLATDHLENPHYKTLIPDDVLDVVARDQLGWDPESQTGAAFHMASAIAVAGCVGVTSIGDSPEQAQVLYDRTKAALDYAATVEHHPRPTV
ncbi:MAG TPA: peptide ligase PGM1-related protein, partial [Actinomycetes bacterium]|nr:peptide ligase PGM1-related protein [Actinomycetes bacterium]